MLPKKSAINYIEQKILLPNLDSWFSNFLIEEFRTDYLPESKIQTKITGLMSQSEGPLPKLFEPSYTSIELGYDYSQEVFDNDIFIFNLDDSYLPEVEFIIRGLENGEYEKEKILILISNIMTWGETPLKTFTEEEMQKEGFNEEEVPEVEDNININLFEEEKNLNEENNKNEKENNENNENQENNEENKDNQSNKENNEGTIQKETIKQEEENEEKKDENKIEGETIEEEELENESQTKKEGEVEVNEPEKPKPKIFYYRETEYTKRVPNLKYLYYKILESNVLYKNKNPKLKAYVICPGFIYGCGEDFFFDYFKLAWLQQLPYVPILSEGKNFIPTIHILDLIKIIRKIIETKPEQKYYFVKDKTKFPTMRNILNSIGMGIGGIPVRKLNRFNIENMELPNYTELKIDIRMKISNIFEEERKSNENIMDFKERQFKWHCEFGIPENMDKLRDEFNLYRNLKPIKIIVSGPPCSGKTTLCEFLTDKYKIK